MSKQDEYKAKVERFIELYNNRPVGENGKPVSNAEIARMSGWSDNRAHKTASELLKKPEILAKIRKVEEEHQVAANLGEDSIKSILDNNIASALEKLKTDPAKFVAAYKQLKSLEKEEESELDGYSIEELIAELDENIKEGEKLKLRIRAEIRTQEMQE